MQSMGQGMLPCPSQTHRKNGGGREEIPKPLPMGTARLGRSLCQAGWEGSATHLINSSPCIRLWQG